MKKRLLPALLALAIVLGLLPLAVFAANDADIAKATTRLVCDEIVNITDATVTEYNSTSNTAAIYDVTFEVTDAVTVTTPTADGFDGQAGNWVLLGIKVPVYEGYTYSHVSFTATGATGALGTEYATTTDTATVYNLTSGTGLPVYLDLSNADFTGGESVTLNITWKTSADATTGYPETFIFNLVPPKAAEGTNVKPTENGFEATIEGNATEKVEIPADIDGVYGAEIEVKDIAASNKTQIESKLDKIKDYLGSSYKAISVNITKADGDELTDLGGGKISITFGGLTAGKWQVLAIGGDKVYNFGYKEVTGNSFTFTTPHLTDFITFQTDPTNEEFLAALSEVVTDTEAAADTGLTANPASTTPSAPKATYTYSYTDGNMFATLTFTGLEKDTKYVLQLAKGSSTAAKGATIVTFETDADATSATVAVSEGEPGFVLLMKNTSGKDVTDLKTTDLNKTLVEVKTSKG